MTLAQKMVFACLVVLLAWAPPGLAQLEPCSVYEVDGQPGYGPVDFWNSCRYWPQATAQPTHPDFNGDGKVNVLDLVQQASCVADLGPGLLSKYFGYDDGTPELSIGFPDFNTIPFDPAVVLAAAYLDDSAGWDGFLETDMRHNFAAAYEGYLAVPETANYTLHISGRQGMRLFLDGAQLLFFDAWPYQEEATVPLQAGLYPIRIEFFNDDGFGSISLAWSSNGSTIPNSLQIIEPPYLFHRAELLDDHTATDLDVRFYPPRGWRTTSANLDVTMGVLAADSNASLWIDGDQRILYDGMLNETLALAPGLNTFEVRIEDGAGRQHTVPYTIYRDAETLNTDGLAANIYATEWYDGRIPSQENLRPAQSIASPGCQLLDDGNGELFINGLYVSGGALVVLEGTINVPTAGEYGFRITDSSGALLINGVPIGRLSYDYGGQWAPRGEMYLEAGRHHFQLKTSSPWGGPNMRVFWTPPGGSETLIPDNVFRYGPAHVQETPGYAPRASGGRVTWGLVAEYLFRPDAPFNDSSGHAFHLWPDPRAVVRSSGGITYQTAGALSSEEAGVQLLARIKDVRAFSFEADFIYEADDFDYGYYQLVSLTGAWQWLADLYLHLDDVFFSLRDSDGSELTIRADDVVVPGQRMHVVGTWDSLDMRLYVNGALVASQPYRPVTDTWPSLGTLDVGQPIKRNRGPGVYGNQLPGTFLVAGVYDRAMSQSNVQTNMQSNLSLTPTPGTLNWPAAPTFPPPGTSAAELEEAVHILNRLSFGPTPDAIREVLSVGVDAWIAQQLEPQTIDDGEMEAYLNSGIYIPDRHDGDLRGITLARMALSKRQLLEVMTQFWENHFNTQINKTRLPREELLENQRFRELALGKFVDLLRASAMNYPMTVYLDSASNVVGAPNENYAREILELHSFGVNNGYTQDDIVEAARCFTGWSVRNGASYFNPGQHDYGQKQLLGITIPAGGGFGDGLQLIEHIAASPNTADFIAWKLCQLFIADNPPADVVAAASAAFLASDGDIKQTLQTIFSHSRFRSDLTYRGNKTKTPLEFAVSIARLLESVPVSNTLRNYLDRMGMVLFDYPEPTGFAEEGVAWMDTNSLLERWNMINELTTNREHPSTPSINFKRMAQRYQFSDADSILDFFEHLVTQGNHAPGTRAIMEDWLTDGNPAGFVLTDQVLDEQVRQTLGLFLRLPEFNKQ